MIKGQKIIIGIKLFIELLFVPLLLVLSPITFAQDFTIEDFHSDIIINEDASIEVTETIKVDFERPKHGIYREIPCSYDNGFDDKLIMPITVKLITNENGRSRPSLITYQTTSVNIRIGDANRYVDGRQIYVIKYHVQNSTQFFESHDELYWNVTGDLWQARILKASATVSLNTEKPNSKLIGACYTGQYGSTESNCNFETFNKEAQFATEVILNINEGFTIALGWDKGIVTPPPNYKQILWTSNIAENWVFFIPVFIFVYMFIRWLIGGRDPKVRDTVTVMYEPPKYNNESLTPAQVGVLIDECFDHRDISSSIINLAVNGFIELHEDSIDNKGKAKVKTEITIKRLKDSDGKLSEFENMLLDSLFSEDYDKIKISKLKNRFYKNIPKLKKIMFNELIKRRYFSVNPEKIRNTYMAVGIFTMLFGIIIFDILTLDSQFKGIIAAILSGLVIFIFAKAMPAKAKAGALAKLEIIGFREFLNRTDKDKIEKMDKDLFYKYLPYAIALDITDNWIDSFSDILTTPPKWYVGKRNSMIFNSASFSRMMHEATTHIGLAAFSAPRGSGLSSGRSFSRGGSFSGRGGSSGGGGGGGGGGSW